MKKIVLLMLLLITVTISNAEIKYFKAAYFNCKVTGQDWGGWTESGVYITIDNYMRHIEIYSATQQSISYSAPKYTTFIGYTQYNSKGWDSMDRPINVIFQEFSNGTFYLIIEYSDEQYTYSLIEKDPN